MKNIIYKIHFPKIFFGQNFLMDTFIINSIVSSINPQRGDILVELGSGIGAITEPISISIDQMRIIEIDYNLVILLKNNPLLKDKLIIYSIDAMRVNFFSFYEPSGNLLRIFGNIPYNISIPLILNIFRYITVIIDMHFMLQKEVVLRFFSTPNSKAYSRLSVIAQYYCSFFPIMEILPTAFLPLPQVHSFFLRVVPHRGTFPYKVSNIPIFKYIITLAFNKRRKNIRNSLSTIFTSEQLMKLNIPPYFRAENISLIQYCKLANFLSGNLNYISIKKNK